MNSTQRRYLRKSAHSLKPVVMIGKQGLSAAVEEQVREALHDHELIKIKFIDYKAQKREFSETLAENLSAEVISIIGNIATLFRQNSDREEQIIQLP